jgi:hypothetical protein
MLWIGTAATLVAGIVALMVVILAKSPVCSERRRDLRGTVNESGRQGPQGGRFGCWFCAWL